jgi:hypothetical protein
MVCLLFFFDVETGKLRVTAVQEKLTRLWAKLEAIELDAKALVSAFVAESEKLSQRSLHDLLKALNTETPLPVASLD